MTELIASDEWLEYLEAEYLSTFLRGGGAAVKFAITKDAVQSARLREDLTAVCQRNGFANLHVSASDTKVHMVERLFFAIARQIDWAYLTDQALRRVALDEGMEPPAVVPGGMGFAEAIANNTGDDITFVRMRLVRGLQRQVGGNRAMVRDFRFAMTWMCQNRLVGISDGESDANLIQRWLEGHIARISELKSVFIYTKINRTNARYHLESLAHWLRFAGLNGTLLTLEIDQLLVARRPAAGEYFTKAALLDAYEVLRQFIDSVDELEGLLLVVIAGEQLLDPDKRLRGLVNYTALRNRVYDEVRDHSHANPASSLVRLAPGGVR